jgi:ribonuclease HI
LEKSTKPGWPGHSGYASASFHAYELRGCGVERSKKEVILDHVEIHTDGACKGNPGPGGWGVLMKSGHHVRELCGGEPVTTNNRMELMAVIQALGALKRPCNIVLYLDSEYVRKGITEWIHGWKAKGWRTAAKQPVKNVDLWKQLDDAVVTSNHVIEWRWVKGHAGDPGNERADALANQGVEKVLAQGS